MEPPLTPQTQFFKECTMINYWQYIEVANKNPNEQVKVLSSA